MRNLSEQKKVATPAIALFFMAILFAVIFIVFYLNRFDVDATIAGYRFYDFTDEVEKVDDYDIDDGDAMKYIAQGSKVLVKETAVADLKENDVIAFYYKDGVENVIVTQIFKFSETDYNGETVYHTHDLDDATMHSFTIDSGKFMGVYVAHVPVLGTVSEYLAAQSWLMYFSLVLLALIMLGTPIVFLIIRIKSRQMGSPFPEGVNINKLKTENLYIYENIREFILSSGMTLDKGYDCDLIYLGKILFGILHCTNGNIYVNINKNFQRYDNKIDRAGYICIPHAANLENAKKRINSIYRAYFMSKKPYAAMPARRRPRPAQRTK